jgi:hypothetical protein
MPTHLVSAEALSAWALGWEAFVAIGTLLLAGVTFLLVLRTRDLARSSDADIRAQWRPTILPALDLPGSRTLEHTGQFLRVKINNAGRGPALFIRTLLEPDMATGENWSLGALAAGDKYVLNFRAAKPDTHAQLLFDYRDLAGRTYSTAIRPRPVKWCNSKLAWFSLACVRRRLR